jgi:hypothetical protein
MSSTDRQNNLLLSEDWKKIYQSFKNAEFKSYDFDSLRRTMISYIRENYPEDFNDYIESSEYLALIDLIAFLGQNISFRVDLNARENFLELAERRESVLRLARLISYNPKRNIPATGLLKFESVSTTENIVDSNGVNISGRNIQWNDNSNPNWYEQFIKVINAALPVLNTFGKPITRDEVAGIPTEQYRLNSISAGVPVYAFSKTVNNVSTNFEVVSTAVANGEIYEEPPLSGNNFSFVYRDNGQGPSSTSTGFFAHFRQGSLQRADFGVNSPVPNQQVDINTVNVNDSDVWLYSLTSQLQEDEIWTKVNAIEGNSVIYNSINKKIRNIFNVLTRENDQISLLFADGTFGSLPQGNFRLYYRTSINRNYSISPNEIKNVTIRIPYVSRLGRTETLSIYLDLKTTITNSSISETNDEIKARAPSTYYTQNRLITGEDYNVGPLGVSQDIIKVKAINRTSSGISRYYDIVDATGKYSKTNQFSDDGVLYKENLENQLEFSFLSKNDIESVIQNKITPLLSETVIRDFYLDQLPYIKNFDTFKIVWNGISSSTNMSTGYLTDINDIKYQVGTFTAGSLKYLESGALVKFIAPTGSYFNAKNQIISGTPSALGDKTYIWAVVVTVSGDGTVNTSAGLGPIVFNDVIPSNAELSEIKPKFSSKISDATRLQILDQIFSYKTFGLRYNIDDRQWSIILETNLNTRDDFSLGKQGDTTNQKLDASWVLLFTTNGEKYTVTYRNMRYVFESAQQIRFYYDTKTRTFNNKSGQIIKDSLKVLSINTQPGITDPFTQDFNWHIVSEFRNAGNQIDNKKIQVSFFDSDDDGVIDNPTIFNDIVDTASLIFLKKSVTDGIENYTYVNQILEGILIVNTQGNIVMSSYDDGQIFYIIADDVFKKLNKTSNSLVQIFDYVAKTGRDNLKFQYIHASDENNRIDPSSTNMIDIYMLTRDYDNAFRLYLQGTLLETPIPQTTDELFRTYGSSINSIKSVSDEVIYHPVKYRVLFGSKADPNLQATFKIVKNAERVVNDNDIKSRVINAIDQFFVLDNWDFGETFYFSELSAHVMKSVGPDLSSIVIVSKQVSKSFGSLFEIRSESDEIFVSGATVDDIEVISALTADRLRSDGSIVTTTTQTKTNLGGTVI